jgi:UDP-N-acetylmuramate--alanine ligase
MRNRVNKIYFVGIGGSGMSGIAEVLANLGYEVSGSDLQEGPVIDRLRAAGVTVHKSHDASQLKDSDVVVVSSAITADNPEVLGAQELRIPVIPRAEMLGELMRFQKGIAVGGTHGKTTTTSLIAALLAAGGLDPTFVVGGQVNSVRTNARLGTGEYLVAEADESDASFLNLKPEMAIVTNIDADHMETYGGDFDKLKRTFIAFLQGLPFYGVAILCFDDADIRSIAGEVRKPLVTYGTSEDCDIRVSDIAHSGLGMVFHVSRPGRGRDLDIELALPGHHNVLNALAAIAVATHLGVSDDAIVKGLRDFEGIGRRFQLLGEVAVPGGNISLVDDYAHHPRELDATLSAARGCWPDRRLVVVFQPHRYTRTRDLFDDFAQVLSECDSLLVTEVYPAGEQPISGADGRALCRAIRARGRTDPVFVENVDELAAFLPPMLKDGDVVLTLGAGSIGRVSQDLAVRGFETRCEA